MKKFLPIFFITFVFLFLFSMPIKADAARLSNLKVSYWWSELECGSDVREALAACAVAKLTAGYLHFSNISCTYDDYWMAVFFGNHNYGFKCDVTVQDGAGRLLPFYYPLPDLRTSTPPMTVAWAKEQMEVLLPNPPTTINSCILFDRQRSINYRIYRYECLADISVPPPTGDGTGGTGGTGGSTVVPVVPACPPRVAAPLCNEPGGLVPCGKGANANPGRCDSVLLCRCELGHVFVLARNIYVFIIWNIATPLAGLLIMIGGLLILLSGANQKLYDMGKTILWAAVWGVGLIFGAYLIMGAVMMAIGYTGPWSGF